MKSQTSSSFILAGCLMLSFLASPVVFAQCAYDVCAYPQDYVQRLNGNSIRAHVETDVSGDYGPLFSPGVIGWEYREDTELTVTNGEEYTWGYFGDYVALDFGTVTLSASGMGAATYWSYGLHALDCPDFYCGYEIFFPPYSDSWDGYFSGYKSISKPTISNLPYGNALWNLGSGTADPTFSYNVGGDPGNPAKYYQSKVLAFEDNCDPGDPCTALPHWPIVSNNDQLTLSLDGTTTGNGTVTGDAPTLAVTSTPGNCSSDTTISANIDGFSSDPVDLEVNSPKYLYRGDEVTVPQVSNSVVVGYITTIQYFVMDACSFLDPITTLPLYETFGSWSVLGVTSGWTRRASPTSGSAFDRGNIYWFHDQIGEGEDTLSGWNPQPTYTSSSPPYTYNSVVYQGPQTWNVGSTTSPNGTNVYSGTIKYYRDHGDSR